MDPRRYLDLFVAESREHLACAARVAARLDLEGDEPAVREVFRHLHSVKGMAATMGFAVMRDLAHATEGVLEACRRGDLDSARGGALVGEATACLERLVDRAARGELLEDTGELPLLDRLRAVAEGGEMAGSGVETSRRSRESGRGSSRLWRVGMRLSSDLPFPAMRAATVLGRLGRLGRVVASTPPPARLRTGHCDGTLAATLESAHDPRALGTALARIDGIESFTLAPIPPAPSPAPTAATPWARLPVATIDAWLADANELVRELTAADAGAVPLALARRLRRRSLDARLVSFEPLAGRLERATGDIARGLGKEAALEVAGRDTPVDRTLFDALADPLLHLLRNALDHGLERPAERLACGKPRRGAIRLTLKRRAAAIEVAFEDDGRGVDLDAVRQRAERPDLDDEATLALLVEPGFSTARSTGMLSGRGVGLDVVAEAVRTLGGRLVLDARPGKGLQVRMTFPFATARLQALVVRRDGALLAIPVSSVRRVSASDGALEVEIERGAGASTLRVDEVQGRHELVVRPLRGPLAQSGAYGAAGVMDDGEPVLVVDPEAL